MKRSDKRSSSSARCGLRFREAQGDRGGARLRYKRRSDHSFMLKPRLQSMLREGQDLQQRRELERAAEVYQRIRDEAPEAFEGWHFGGMAALLLGKSSVAVSLLAAALERNPSSLQTAMGLGMARLANGDAVGAEKVLRNVTVAAPNAPEGWHYLALALKAQQRVRDVLTVRQRMVKLTPKSAAAWLHLGSAMSDAGRYGRALEGFAKAMELEPANPRIRLTRAMTLFKCHRVREAALEFANLTSDERLQFTARSCRLMTLNYLPELTREEVFAEHVAYGRAAGPEVNRSWRNDPDPERRLRVAFLSPDLNQHSVAYFLEPMLLRLDPREFEVVLYHDDTKVDAVSERLKSLAAVWRNFANRPNEAVEPEVLSDAPDVLIDLTGHAGSNRLRLLARRLAPVQITYLGYPNTTGVRAMDYRFVDELTDPTPDADRFASEGLIRFAATAWSYLPRADAPDVNPLPAKTNGFVTFGSFNNFAKVTNETLHVWARILAGVPASRLLLKAAGMDDAVVRGEVVQRLRAAGISEERCELMAPVPDTTSHLAMYGRVDIALDTFPYHGTTTTCEALWMGVPVVTQVGERHVSRVGLSLLAAVGHREWASASAGEYVSVATELAGDVTKLDAMRRGLRGEMERSNLLDHAGQARRFGGAVRKCWARWCAKSAARAAA